MTNDGFFVYNSGELITPHFALSRPSLTMSVDEKTAQRVLELLPQFEAWHIEEYITRTYRVSCRTRHWRTNEGLVSSFTALVSSRAWVLVLRLLISV